MRAVAALVLIAAAAASPLDAGRALCEALARGDFAQISARLAEDLRASVGSAEALRELRDSALQSWGEPIATLSETVEERGPRRVYVRRALHERAVVVAEWAFDAKGVVDGFAVKQADSEAASPHLTRATRAALRLPFDGEWFVYWGGRSLDENAHAARPDHRFASDFLIARKGRTRKGGGSKNEDYFAFGEPVLSPSAGTVVRVVAGIADNTPGSANPRAGLGNHVVLDLADGEFAFLGHLQRDSIAVSEGAMVAPGQLLGRCGNSGASTQPHLHFHLQDSPDENRGLGLPAQFQGYAANGRSVPGGGEPRKGQTVRKLR